MIEEHHHPEMIEDHLSPMMIGDHPHPPMMIGEILQVLTGGRPLEKGTMVKAQEIMDPVVLEDQSTLLPLREKMTEGHLMMLEDLLLLLDQVVDLNPPATRNGKSGKPDKENNLYVMNEQ